MSANRFVLSGFPQPASPDDYARAAAELEQALTALPGAIAVYRYGAISAPGISDLDRLVVIEECRAVPSVWPQLNEHTRYLAMHTPALADPATFARHRWFAELGNPELAWGTDIPVEDRPVPEYSEPLLAAEALVITALKLSKLSTTQRAKVRPWLCELANLRLDLCLAGLTRVDAPQAWSLADATTLLRQSWWQLDEAERHRRFAELLASAPVAIAQAIERLATATRGDYPARDVRLARPWENVTLTTGDFSELKESSRIVLTGRSRRFGEARWRWVQRRLALPRTVISLLAGPPPAQFASFREEREALAQRHRAHLSSSPGYSPLLLAPALAV